MSNAALKSFKIMNAVSASATATSTPTNIQYLDNIGFQYTVSGGGSPVGALTVQVSLDYDQDSQGNVLNTGNWTNIQTTPGTDLSLAVAADGTYYLDINQLAAPWVRLKYTRTSGTGTATAYISGKAV